MNNKVNIEESMNPIIQRKKKFIITCVNLKSPSSFCSIAVTGIKFGEKDFSHKKKFLKKNGNTLHFPKGGEIARKRAPEVRKYTII